MVAVKNTDVTKNFGHIINRIKVEIKMSIAKKRININNMSTKKIWLIIGTFAVLCAGVVGVNAYLSKKPAPATETPEEITEESAVTEPEESTSTVSEEISSTSESDTSDWMTYRNEEHGFKFQYPKIYDTKEEYQSCRITERDGEFNIGGRSSLSIVNSEEINLSKYVDQLINIKIEDIDAKESRYINGREAISISYRFGGVGRFGVATFLFKDKKVFTFNYTAGASICDYKDISDYVVYEKMVSTFRFIEDENNLKNWKTYKNEEYGFEIKYPFEYSFWEASYSPDKAELIDIGFQPGNIQGSVLSLTILNIPVTALAQYENGLYGEHIDERIKLGNLTGTKFSGSHPRMIGITKDIHTFFFKCDGIREEDLEIFDLMLSTFKFSK
jgi:hypothetical protein